MKGLTQGLARGARSLVTLCFRRTHTIQFLCSWLGGGDEGVYPWPGAGWDHFRRSQREQGGVTTSVPLQRRLTSTLRCWHGSSFGCSVHRCGCCGDEGRSVSWIVNPTGRKKFRNNRNKSKM